MEVQDERRVQVRHPVSFLGNFGVSEGRLLNLSLGGCAIESDTPPELDTVVPLRVHMPSQDPPIEVELAEVTWTAGRNFGVRFLQLEASQEKRLHCLIIGLEHGVQKTGPV
ncbi:MAG: PilZ domain-containing protein [Nitrospirae bacterium]|nr:PilZ domain-containing protein [Nitrospirota bacterium]